VRVKSLCKNLYQAIDLTHFALPCGAQQLWSNQSVAVNSSKFQLGLRGGVNAAARARAVWIGIWLIGRKRIGFDDLPPTCARGLDKAFIREASAAELAKNQNGCGRRARGRTGNGVERRTIFLNIGNSCQF